MCSNAAQELMSIIDSHLAEQLSYQQEDGSALTHRASHGTMFVDWDGTGEPIITYRNRTPYPNSSRSTSSPPLIVADDNMQVKYQRPQSTQPGTMYVEGYDPDTEFRYDYDGQVFHVHRDASRPESQHSDYYAIDAQQYDSAGPSTQLQVVDEERPPTRLEMKKRDRVVGLIQRLLMKLSTLGLLKRFKEENKKKKAAKEQRRNSRPPRPQIPAAWVVGGKRRWI